MKTITNIQNTVKEAYIAVIIGILGIFAFLSAILIAYPALAYLASKMFM
jgi:hypothetical protein